ncbi:MAG: FeoB small GTPase domain-containing protein, partial [Saprospiraceae bacterium]
MTTNLALVGNPNCGKSTLFNVLTGLRQRTGNFPGVTVEQKTGTATFGDHLVELVDLPGTYSLHPSSLDERVVLDSLLGFYPAGTPDAVLYVADANKLDKHLLLLTQVMDLGIPVVLALNLIDELHKSETTLDFDDLSKSLGVPVVGISARTGEGIEHLKQAVAELLETRALPTQNFYSFSSDEKLLSDNLAVSMPDHLPYARLLVAHHGEDARVPAGIRIARAAAVDVPEFDTMRWQVRETMQRFDRFLPTLRAARKTDEEETMSDKIDRVVTHPVAGPIIFFAVLFLVFQAIFTWSSWPTEMIETSFAFLGDTVRDVLPKGYLADFIVDGILA